MTYANSVISTRVNDINEKITDLIRTRVSVKVQEKIEKIKNDTECICTFGFMRAQDSMSKK